MNKKFSCHDPDVKLSKDYQVCSSCGLVKRNSKFDGWISVEDRLPEYGARILTIMDNGYRQAATWKSLWITDATSGRVTHWMPLPKPPEDKDND